MGATLKDVAKLAGVNFTLVSKYLNHDPAARMTQETKAKIDAAIRQLDYRPSAAARTLRSGRSHIVGFVCGDLTNMYFAHAADCALKECQRRGYQMLIAFADPEKPEEALRLLTGHGVDGIYGFSMQKLPKNIAELSCPLITNNLPADSCSSVVIDSAEALDQAFSAVQEREIVGLFTPPSPWANAFSASVSHIGKTGILHKLSVRREKRRKELQTVCQEHPPVLFSNGWETMCDLMELLDQEFPEYQPKLILHANCCGPFLGDHRIFGVVESSSIRLIQTSFRALLAQIETPGQPPVRETIPVHFLAAGTPEYSGLVRRRFQLT